jgi:outer membrane protein
MRVPLAVILFFCFCANIFAVTGPDFSKPLTEEECVRIALVQSPSIVKARATVTQASAGRQSAWSALVPQVNGQGSYNKTGPITSGVFISPKGQLTPYNGGLYSGNLSATQTLFDVGQFAQVAQANKNYEGAKAGEVGTRQLLAYTVKQAYYNLVKARRTVQAVQTALEQSAEQERVTEEMKRVGSVAQVDLLKVQVQLSQSKTDLLTAQNGEAVARANLCAAMGIDVNTPVQVIDEVTY